MSLRRISTALLFLILGLPFTAKAADKNNPEDEDIPDEDVPAVPVKPPATPTRPTQPPSQPQPPVTPPTAPEPPPVQVQPPAQPNSSAQTNQADGTTITIPRAEWEAMKTKQDALQKQLDELRQMLDQRPQPAIQPPAETPTIETPPPVESDTGATAADTQPTASANKSLLLPDISLVMQAKGLGSTDRRDANRGSFRLSEGELAIQSYVYPNVKADAYIVGAPAEDEPLQFEEGYLTFLGVTKGLNLNVGRKFVPFGRTGELHTHSWLYTRQLLPFRNLVAEEALVGDGVNLNYLFPTKGKLFVRASLGLFNGEGPGEVSSNPFGVDIPGGPGAGFHDRFISSRLWLGHPVGANGELELGASHARGRSLLQDDAETILGRGRVALTGADISYRRFMGGNRRLLLRSEYFRHAPRGGLTTTSASGYYMLGNLRYKPRNDIGLLYENSGFPQAPGRESAMSLVYTRQFTEQFFMRLQGTRGNRPGKGSYNEAWLQFVWGVGPHTHSLE